MSKLIIWISGRPNLNGHKRREFLWSEPHGCYLYCGKEYELSEFNEAYEKAFKNNADFYPRVKVIDAPAAAQKAAPISEDQKLSMTLEQAEAILQQHAPERLKKKTGPKPVGMEVE